MQLSAAADRLSQTHIYIDDTAGITVSEIKAKCRKLRDLGLIVIDYLQLIESGSRTENRVQEVSKITRTLKVMAKELGCAGAGAQPAEPGGGKPHRPTGPMLSDLRESGSIEQDADIVLMLTREGLLQSGDGASQRGPLHFGQKPPRQHRGHQAGVERHPDPVYQFGAAARAILSLVSR